MASDRASMEFLVNHIVLPPKLPQEKETDDEESKGEKLLLQFVLKAMSDLIQHCKNDQANKAWQSARSGLRNWEKVSTGSSLCKNTLIDLIANLKEREPVLLFIKAQNCGLLIRKNGDEQTILDVFEASAESETVVQAKGSLLWTFPGRGVKVPHSIFKDKRLTEELAEMLQRLHMEQVQAMKPTSRKSGGTYVDERDTVHPGLVSELLLSTLAAFGDHFDSPKIQKRVRDEVNSGNDSKSPWRRSPFWLVIRVALNLVLRETLEPSQARDQFKSFMVILIAQVSDAVKESVTSDVKAIINAKLTRRLTKLGDDGQRFAGLKFATTSAKNAVSDSCDSLESLWLQIQQMESEKRRIRKLPHIATEKDTELRLLNSRPYLVKAIENEACEDRPTNFMPEDFASLNFQDNGLPHLTEALDPKDRVFLLDDFEHWIFENLGKWDQGRPSCDQDCESLAAIHKYYVSLARSLYGGNSRAISTMLLTSLEIWRVLDLTCLKVYPMLSEYSPEIPTCITEPLLLPKLYHMEKLLQIEEHLKKRHEAATYSHQFLGNPTPNSFSVRYYDRSPIHQALRMEIEHEARLRRNRKVKEWTTLSKKHENLRKRAWQKPHEHKTNGRKTDGRKKPQECDRCSIERAAEKLEITVEEWPLPEDLVQLKAAVFELDCPTGFIAWRDTTWSILMDLGRAHPVKGKWIHAEVLSYHNLRQKASIKGQRITLGSRIKSSLYASGSIRNFPVDLNSILKKNTLKWRLWDRHRRIWPNDQTESPSFHSLCVSNLPRGPYARSGLQDFVDKSSVTPNDAIAKQENCAFGINHHEFLAFATLRAGERIQWHNLLRELASADMTFRAIEVHILIRQTAIQAGSNNGGLLRTTHQVFENDSFSNQLLGHCLEHLEAIQSNWKERHRLSTLIVLVQRILSLTPAPAVADRAGVLLRRLRGVGLTWCRQLTSQLSSCSTKESAKKMRTAILKLALVCHMAFDTESKNISRVLRTQEDVANMVETSVHIFNNRPIRMEDLPEEVRRSFLLSQKLSRRVFDHLKLLIAKDSAGMKQAMGNTCKLTNFAGDWAFSFGPKNSWIANETSHQSGGRRQQLHYNLLTGELLIDGQTLGRLPSELSEMPLYRRIFGSRILNVSASNLHQTQYRSLDKIEGYTIHIGLHEGELIIKATTDMQVLRIIPHETFHGDIPHQFQYSFIHWMDMETRVIELRPAKSPWTSPSTPTRIHFNLEGRSSMRIGSDVLVDIRSTLGKSVATIFAALERDYHVVVTTSSLPNGGVQVELPRFGLKFWINEEGLLECQQFSSTVAMDQDLGCLYGLRNKLVLSGSQKSVLVPLGAVTVSNIDGRKRVRIQNGDGEKVRFVHYYQNTTLGTLSGATDITELLFKAYLHALTSFPRPDPLTKHTGTAEALLALSDQRLRTAFPLTEEAIQLLTTISELTPRREYYPKNPQRSQRITWDSHLDQLSQHEGFSMLALDIFSHNARFAILSNDEESSEGEQSDSRGNHYLLQRSYLRNPSVRIPSLDKEISESDDKVYIERDREAASCGSLRVYDIAVLILEWPSQLQVSQDLVKEAESWEDVAGYGKFIEQGMDITCTNILSTLPSVGHWGYLYELCRGAKMETDRYRILFLFTMMTYEESSFLPYLQALLGIAFSGAFQSLVPEHSYFDLSSGRCPNPEILETEIAKSCQGFEEAENEPKQTRDDRYNAYLQKKQQQTELMARFVETQWPCQDPSLPDPVKVELIDVDGARQNCAKLFAEWYRNHKYFDHLKEVQETLIRKVHSNTSRPKSKSRPRNIPKPLFDTSHTQDVHPSLMSLLSSRTSPTVKEVPQAFVASRSKIKKEPSSNHDELRPMLENLRSGGSDTRVAYLDDMLSSVDALEDFVPPHLPQDISESMDDLMNHKRMVLDFLEKSHAEISHALRPTSAAEELAAMTGHWPRMSSYSLLTCLSAARFKGISRQWRLTLTVLGECIAQLQRSERLIDLKSKHDVLGFYKEAEEAGRQEWKPLVYPEWLLIEVENNIQIRRTQAIVAQKMIAPVGDKNSVLQLNMGEGKSSIIIPMVLVALANRNQVVRLIVLKPLLQQTHVLLSQRLGGLVNRAVYHTPFTRDTDLDEERIATLQDIYVECMENQGVILALPEHILSFRLLGREKLPKQQHLGHSLMSLDLWLQKNCRDVLDESDELLDSKFQLVYSHGNQQHMDAHSERWVCIQEVFTALMDFVEQNKEYLPIQLDYRGRSFPFMTFNDRQACFKVLGMLADDIISLCGVSTESSNQQKRSVGQSFIKKRKLEDFELAMVNKHFSGSQAWEKLHLLRGLFAHGVLDFALQEKLWQVNYGLALDRCLLAVPYRAKGVPSARSEYSHPDLSIALTCLSYYYSGLTQEQLKHAFEILISEADPSSEYSQWTPDDSELPPGLRRLDGVNVDDSDVFGSQLFPALRYSKAAADFYMSKVVFPREAKQFPSKLSLSAWDLPSVHNRTTGFSGTNDNKSLLPKSIIQQDLEKHHHTNAMVIQLLLKEENRAYIELKDDSGRRLDLNGLLRTISQHPKGIQVLIDVGAQVIEAGNEEVAKRWLEFSPEYEAAVFFDESDEVMVVDRSSHIERLSVSPFKRKLDQTLVYLDEAHTRGVDLDLPLEARAAVTLGPTLTKDRLVQGCMRMRKLGAGQSLLFLAPPEVHRGILAIAEKTGDIELDSLDVMRWALIQTCNALESMRLLYLTQGLEHCHRNRVCSKISQNFDVAPTEEEVKSFNEEILEPEARKLEEMYGVDASKNIVRPCLISKIAQRDRAAKLLIKELMKLNAPARQDSSFQEEQEREISHEVEQVQEVQKAPLAESIPHTLHQDVETFVKTGEWLIGAGSPFYPAFEALRKTTAYKELAVDETCRNIFVTKDFMGTVDQEDQPDQDQFIRPVKWVVSDTATRNLLIISPYEANELLPMFETSTAVRLHVFAATTSKKMRSFSDLSFFTVTGIRPKSPPDDALALERKHAIAQLDIFSGSVFLRNYDSYLAVCEFLGLITRKNRPSTNSRKKQKTNKKKAIRTDGIAEDGFTQPDVRSSMNWSSPFQSTPLPFLKALMGIRRKGQAFGQTHMGSIVDAHTLTEDSFEDESSDSDSSDDEESVGGSKKR